MQVAHTLTHGMRLADAIKAVPECIKIVARDGALLDMTPAGLAMLQAATLAEAQAKPLIEFLAAEDRAAFGALHAQVFEGRAGRLTFDVIGLKGRRRTLETYAVPLARRIWNRGEPAGCLARCHRTPARRYLVAYAENGHGRRHRWHGDFRQGRQICLCQPGVHAHVWLRTPC